MIEYYDFTKGGMQQIPGFETLGSKLLGQANPFWKSTENRAAKETTKQPQVKKTPVRTSRVSSMLRDDFLKGFNRDKDEKSFMFVEEPEREEDAFLSGFNQILNEEKKEQAERKKRQEKLTQIRANADKRAWEDAPQNEDDAFLQGFNEAADKPESAKKAPSKKDKILDGISTALTAASFIPGVDTVTNLLSVPVDLLRGDYISAGLDLVGAIPFVGEVADVARTARTADRIIDGARLADKAADTVKVADGVADSIKAVDKATDALKTADTAVDAAKAGSNVGELAKPYPKENLPHEVDEYLSGLLKDGERVQVNKAPSLEEISLMSRQEAVEFASVTIGDRNYVLRGNVKGTNISQEMLEDMIQNKGILNCHSHPYIGDVQPSQSDLKLAEMLSHQREFKIVTPDGMQAIYTKEGIKSVGNIANKLSAEDIQELYKLFGG